MSEIEDILRKARKVSYESWMKDSDKVQFMIERDELYNESIRLLVKIRDMPWYKRAFCDGIIWDYFINLVSGNKKTKVDAKNVKNN